jgi:uncharacterized RDD family membrane protein YckC
MEFEDTMTITTPEGIDLHLSLAGLGSRFSAALVDLLIQGLLWIGVTVVWVAFGILRGWGLFAYTIIVFVVIAAYNTLFEVLASGRTPGKRLNGLRVVRVGGFPIGFLSSAIRNMLRLVDMLPTAYLVGCVTILVTQHNQRLGDLAAGTLVVRERKATSTLPAPRPLVTEAAYPTWDVSTITSSELQTVRQFLERRDSIAPQARLQLAYTLAERLRPKVGGAPADLRGESFLEAVFAAKSTRGSV